MTTAQITARLAAFPNNIHGPRLDCFLYPGDAIATVAVPRVEMLEFDTCEITGDDGTPSLTAARGVAFPFVAMHCFIRPRQTLAVGPAAPSITFILN